LASVFIFNVFDTVGRYCGSMDFFDLSTRWININAFARVIFILTFLMTDFVVSPKWVWDADWFKITNLVLFAFSNGYISTLCAVKAPS